MRERGVYVLCMFCSDQIISSFFCDIGNKLKIVQKSSILSHTKWKRSRNFNLSVAWKNGIRLRSIFHFSVGQKSKQENRDGGVLLNQSMPQNSETLSAMISG